MLHDTYSEHLLPSVSFFFESDDADDGVSTIKVSPPTRLFAFLNLVAFWLLCGGKQRFGNLTVSSQWQK